MLELGSSRFASAIGVRGAFNSKQKLFRLLTQREEREPTNDRMQWGIDNELNAVGAVECHTGILFDATGEDQERLGMTRKVGEHEFTYSTTPDGLKLIGDKAYGLEVKCPQNLPDDVPAHYVPQLIGQAAIAGLDDIYFACWTPNETRIWLVQDPGNHWGWMEPLLDKFMLDWASDTEPKRAKKSPTLPTLTTERIL